MKLKMWLRESLKNLIWVLVISVFYSLLISTDGNPIISRLELMPYYFAVGGWMIQCVMSGISLFYYIPLSVSMGSTRKSCFVGLQILKLLPCVIITAACWLITLLIKSEVTAGVKMFLPAIFMVLITGGSIGAIIGCIKLRFGKVGAVIMVAVFALLGGLNGFFIASRGMLNIFSFQAESAGSLNLLLGIITLALLAASVITQYFSLRKYEVKLI